MFRLILASALALLLLAAAEPVPNINPEPSCRSAAERAKPVGNIEACMRVEQSARDQLVKRWGEFTAQDKASCIPLVTKGGTPTYTELLTCLEMTRDARLLRESEERRETEGRATTADCTR
jgi:hypothetical protein